MLPLSTINMPWSSLPRSKTISRGSTCRRCRRLVGRAPVGLVQHRPPRTGCGLQPARQRHAADPGQVAGHHVGLAGKSREHGGVRGRRPQTRAEELGDAPREQARDVLVAGVLVAEPRRPGEPLAHEKRRFVGAVVVGVRQPEQSSRAQQEQEQPPELRAIFQHSKTKSVGKLWRMDRPIPAGWQGGAGRVLSLEFSQRENQLSATLAGGEEGQMASLVGR